MGYVQVAREKIRSESANAQGALGGEEGMISSQLWRNAKETWGCSRMHINTKQYVQCHYVQWHFRLVFNTSCFSLFQKAKRLTG